MQILTPSDVERIDFAKSNGLIPVIAQDVRTDKVLMLGYADKEAILHTLKSARLTFFSRSKNRLWTKGESSGNFLDVATLHLDCDRDTILAKVSPRGPACHTGADTCFEEQNSGNRFLHQLEYVIRERRDHPVAGSYTAELLRRGINKVAQKVGEEAVELVIEAKDDNDDLFRNEAADLLYHLLVLLAAKHVTLDEVLQVLEQRHQ